MQYTSVFFNRFEYVLREHVQYTTILSNKAKIFYQIYLCLLCVCVTTFIKNPNGRVSYSNKNCFLINLSVVCVTVFIETQRRERGKGRKNSNLN